MPDQCKTTHSVSLYSSYARYIVHTVGGWALQQRLTYQIYNTATYPILFADNTDRSVLCACLYSQAHTPSMLRLFQLCVFMSVSELGIPSRCMRAVPVSDACEQYWMFCGAIYIICEPLLLRPPYGRYREGEQLLSIRSYRAAFLHWADLQAPGGTLRLLSISHSMRRYLPTPPRRV